MSDTWATDTAVSFPEPPTSDVPVLVDFEGFGFTMNGMAHNISGTDLEEMLTPHFAPEGFVGLPDHPMGSRPEREARE
jgi:hypothetical protein